jgi:putative flippase GtrA
MAKRMPEESTMDFYDTQPTPTILSRTETTIPPTAQNEPRRPSYHPTGVALFDRALDRADQVTGGRGEWIQRSFSYLFIGGIAAIVNLTTLQLMLNLLEGFPFSHQVHYIIAFAIATEISILANFIPNDRITFSHLPGHSRTWIQRCARFHLTTTGGIIITFAVSSLLHLVFKVPALPAQAVALIVATAFNFTFHHIFTYRHKAPQVL